MTTSLTFRISLYFGSLYGALLGLLSALYAPAENMEHIFVAFIGLSIFKHIILLMLIFFITQRCIFATCWNTRAKKLQHKKVTS